jgi:hypothetical protein
MDILTISEEIWMDIGEDPVLSPTLISLWVREHIGDLNILLSTDFSINTDSEILPDPGESEKSLLKQFYLVYYYTKKVNDVLSAATSSSVAELTEGGATIRFLNKNDTARNYISVKKDEQAKLDKMIFGYRQNNAAPSQVSGPDGEINLNYPPYYYYLRNRRGY